jgi:hypothetical protein
VRELLADRPVSFRHLNPDEKREYLDVLSDVVWDIETELARAKAERAALLSSLQVDLQRELRSRATVSA